jgi:hypothetical protein
LTLNELREPDILKEFMHPKNGAPSQINHDLLVNPRKFGKRTVRDFVIRESGRQRSVEILRPETKERRKG